ncbi:hypothetical protein EDC04DRAFT_2605657 [Pisolithus marmoratus]|nr:hypothetical protein EDC04DRAFT_2605657 [Pisolithus marmoratus]
MWITGGTTAGKSFNGLFSLVSAENASLLLGMLVVGGITAVSTFVPNALTYALHWWPDRDHVNSLTCILHVDGIIAIYGSLLTALLCVGDMIGGDLLTGLYVLNAFICIFHAGGMSGGPSYTLHVNNVTACTYVTLGARSSSCPCSPLFLSQHLPTFEVNTAIRIPPLPKDVTLLGKFPTVQSMAEHAIGKGSSLSAERLLTPLGCLLVAEHCYFLMQDKQHDWKKGLSLAVEEYRISNIQTAVSTAVEAAFHQYNDDMDALCEAVMNIIMDNRMYKTSEHSNFGKMSPYHFYKDLKPYLNSETQKKSNFMLLNKDILTTLAVGFHHKNLKTTF